ncbi:MAG TPA: TIM44-related membrane protein TimA [Caulobacteraceae bacterium]
MPLIELIIFAVLAGVVLYQLYSVLGRRVGRQPEDLVPPTAAPRTLDDQQPEAPLDEAPSAGLAALRARDHSFDDGSFLHGARQAYEMIVIAFAKGDRETLKPLLAAPVMEGFETVMSTRESEGRSEQVEFLHPPRADLERVETVGDLGRAVVRFLAEFRSRSKGPEGEAVDDRRTAELWTFERSLKSRDPNWTLVHVDTAEA